MADLQPIALLAPLGGYLIGSIPTAYIMGRVARGLDIREHGSGNVGATNALRVLGKPLGIACLLIDLAKGAAPVLVARALLPALHPATPWVVAATALAAILGHIFTIFLRFRGGKGVASTVGALLALDAAPVAAAVALGVVAIAVTRFVSVGSILIALCIPVFMTVQAAALGSLGLAEYHAPLALSVLLAATIVLSHRANIRRLRAGTEKRLGERAAEAPKEEKTAGEKGEIQDSRAER